MSRISYRDQYSELELLYRESRNFLNMLQRDQKRSEQERRLKQLRLTVLRAARDTLYDLARQDPEAGHIEPPADFGRDPS